MNPLHHRGLKAILVAPWTRVAPTRDLPIAFFRAGVQLRRGELCQAFSQPTGPGRLWISLGAILLSDSQFADDRIKS